MIRINNGMRKLILAVCLCLMLTNVGNADWKRTASELSEVLVTLAVAAMTVAGISYASYHHTYNLHFYDTEYSLATIAYRLERGHLGD